jgi:hypothetical protein
MSVKWQPYQGDKEELNDSFDVDRIHGYHPKVADLPIVSIDGEGYNDANGVHHYDLLAAVGDSWQEYISDPIELKPDQIFEFLMSLPDKHGAALYFIYGGSYDATMWLYQLGDRSLKRMHKYGHCSSPSGQYFLKYIPRREFIIRDKLSLRFKLIKRGKHIGKYRRIWDRQIHIYDVIGFFQMSFVKALSDWKITDQETIDRIANMKAQRGTFSEVEKQRILEYCLEECRLLVKLGNEFRKACYRANVVPRHWYGAGALASTLMRQYGVKEFLSEEPEVKRYWAHAYFGGRTEITYQGRLPRGGYQYDINSAYPTAMVALPCLRHGKWKFSRNPISNYNRSIYGIWHVKWNCHGKLWGPFPWRDGKGRIYYPDSGEGYYHRIEIDAANALYPDCEFEILEGWIFTPNCDHKPFDFIPERAAYRLQLKAEGEPANKPLKLGLNSLYGKTAQTVGENPPYQNFFWAGLITATTRARLLDAIRYCNGTVYSVATDGLISSVEIDELPVGTTLGTWEKTKIEEGILIRPGVYKWREPNGKWHYGQRGFMSDEVTWEQIEQHWDSGNIIVPLQYSATRFIGLRQAMARGKNWREHLAKWITQDRIISFIPTMGTRWWNTASANENISPLRIQFQGGFVELRLLCNCDNNLFNGASNMYVRLKDEDFEDIIKQLIDEDQP